MSELEGRGVVHIAGPDVRVGNQLRQRCSWCGAVLLDYDLELVAVALDPLSPGGTAAATPATWPIGALVRTDENVSSIVPHEDGDRLPPEACGQLPHDVTGTRYP